MTVFDKGDRVFGKDYAEQYDFLYEGKDYEAECDLMVEVFRRYAEHSVKTVLDLGCGTGRHAMILAHRGYLVTGVDCSEDMLAKARESTPAHMEVDKDINCKPPAFHHGDLRTVNLHQQFDAVLMMFAVLGYQLTNDDVLAALHTVSRHLRPGGIFICDVWYGPAVLTLRPGDRIKVVAKEDGKLIRAASGSLDTLRHLCTVHYRIWRLAGQRVLTESEETHQMRYFFPQELALFMSQENLDLIHICTFGELSDFPNEHTWNILAVGKRKKKVNNSLY